MKHKLNVDIAVYKWQAVSNKSKRLVQIFYLNRSRGPIFSVFSMVHSSMH